MKPHRKVNGIAMGGSVSNLRMGRGYAPKRAERALGS